MKKLYLPIVSASQLIGIKGSKLIDSLEALGHQITLPVPSFSHLIL